MAVDADADTVELAPNYLDNWWITRWSTNANEPGAHRVVPSRRAATSRKYHGAHRRADQRGVGEVTSRGSVY